MTTSPTHDPSTPETGGADLGGVADIHDAIRRSVQRLVAVLTAPEAIDIAQARSLVRWYDGFAGELHNHHVNEDGIFFPALADRVPAFDDYASRLTADHDALDHTITALRSSLDRFAASEAPSDRADAAGRSVELLELMGPHLDLEDNEIHPLFERHFTAEEYEVLEQEMLKDLDLRQALFTVPWYMATVDPVEAAEMRARAPLPLRIIDRLTRRRYARLEAAAFGRHAGERVG